MSENVYIEFAKIVKSYSHTSDAADVAKQYADKTQFEQSKPNDFMFNEHNTWELMHCLASLQGRSDIERDAAIRQWVSKIPKDINLLDKIRELEVINQELEEELNEIVRRNTILRLHSGEKPAKIRRIENSMEPLYQQRYQQLRSCQFEPVKNNTTLDYLYNEYIKFNRVALGEYDINKINMKERSSWRDCVKHMANDDSLGEYGKALIYTLCGNVPDLCKLMGKTWEDLIWIYLNGKIEQTLDSPSAKRTDSAILTDQEIIKLALEKDEIMEKDDPRILFHKIQTAILSNNVPTLMNDLHQGLVKKTWDFKSNYAQVLRFLSTLILFGREYLGWAEDSSSTALLTAYVELNSQNSTFRPVVIVSYASKLPLNDQIRVFSEFLESFDGDKEECRIICRLGKDLGLNMRDTLLTTSKNILSKAFAHTIPLNQTFEATPPQNDSKRYDIFFRAIEWLLLDESLALETIKSVNEIVLHFFAYRKIYLVKRMIDMLPKWVYDQLAKENKLNDQAIDEFDLNRKVVLLFSDYHEWETLIKSKPEDNGSLADLQAIYTWRDELEGQTLKIEDLILNILEGGWLRGASIKKDKDSRVAIRQAYIPEILIRYHNLLHSTDNLVSANKGRSSELVNYVTDEHKELFEDITSSKSWDRVIQEFSKSLF